MKYLSIACLLAAACGSGVHSGQEPGAPIFVLQGQIDGNLPAGLESNAAIRAALVWQVDRPEYATCVAEAADFDAYQSCIVHFFQSPGAVAEDVAINRSFPTGFEIPVYTPPPPEALVVHGTSKYSTGRLIVYQDGNGNGRLDWVDHVATSSDDWGVGGAGDELEWWEIRYREGDSHGTWRWMYATYGCPAEEPAGFSLVRQWFGEEDVSCEVLGANTPVPVALSDDQNTKEDVCLPEGPAWDPLPIQQPPQISPLEGGSWSCVELAPGFAEILELNVNPGAFCTSNNTVEYWLADPSILQGWDVSANPPQWWPCQ